MLKITGYVMRLAPIAVFAAMAATVTTQGSGSCVTYGKFMGGFYFSLACCGACWSLAGFVFLGPRVLQAARR